MNAGRSVATLLGQFPPIGVATGLRDPTRDLLIESTEESACGACGRRLRRRPYMSRTASRLVELEAPFGAAVSEITMVDCHTDDGRALQPVLTSPPVSVRIDRGVTVPARGSDDPAPRTGRPTGPCACRAGSGDPRRLQARAPTTIRPAAVEPLTAPRVAALSHCRRGRALGYRATRTPADRRPLRLVSCCSEPSGNDGVR